MSPRCSKVARVVTVMAAIGLSLHCSSQDDSSFATNGSGAGAGSNQSETRLPDFGSSGTPATNSSGASGAPRGNGTPEICDGIDNDANGVIDDLDVGHDGICDCLRIATLGKSGFAGDSGVFGTWLNSRSAKGATALEGQVLTPALLNQYQVIVAQNLQAIQRSYSADEVAAFSAWVKAGGGFITLIGYGDPTEVVNVNSLLAPFGTKYGSQPILSKSTAKTVAISTWTAHPVTEGILKVGVDNGYDVEGTGATLAMEAGHVVLKAQEVGAGHVLVWGDEWITFNSEWVGQSDYQVERFWVNMIKWSSPVKECQVPVPPNVR
jgi:hypothetical protein